MNSVDFGRIVSEVVKIVVKGCVAVPFCDGQGASEVPMPSAVLAERATLATAKWGATRREGRFRPVSLRFFLTGLLLFLGTTGLLPAEDVVPESTPAAQATAQEQPLNIDIPTVEGQDVLGIRIPHHDENGKLVFQLSAEKARRLNDQDVEMEDMELIFYDEQDQKFEVLIPLSTFNLESKQLHGDSGATISREDFTIEGEVIDFDLAKQSGVLRGDVTMTIHQTDSLEP